MNRKWIALVLLTLGANFACAASFDCDKAGTKVEKMICADPELSKLDENLGAAYRKTLKESSDPAALKQQQRGWMKKRDKCVNNQCVKALYESRLARISKNTDLQLVSEKAKGEMVGKILNGIELQLKPGPMLKPHKNAEFCETFLKDFKQQRSIEYIEPKFITSNYNHPELVRIRSQCPNIKWEWMAPKKCDAKALAYWLKGYSGDKAAALEKADEICATQFGENKFALYEIGFDDHKEYIIYHNRTPKLDPDELDALLREPSKKELWVDHGAWNRRTNTVMNVFFSSSGYTAFNLSVCSKNGTNIGKLATLGATSPESLQGLVEYNGKYLAYNLMRSGNMSKAYEFIVAGINPICNFNVVNARANKIEDEK